MPHSPFSLPEIPSDDPEPFPEGLTREEAEEEERKIEKQKKKKFDFVATPIEELPRVQRRNGNKKKVEKKKGEFMRTLKEFGMGLFIAFMYALYLASRPSTEISGSPKLAVLATMGSGTRALTREFRRLGLDMAHESTDLDGAVSWLHLLLYNEAPSKDAKSLCDDVVPGAWHPQTLFLDVDCPIDYGNSSKCWLKKCHGALDRWIGCASRGDCPRPFHKEPLVMVRHPLRTIESLVRHFCTDDFETPRNLHVANAVVGLPWPTKKPLWQKKKPLWKAPCVEKYASYWRAYYDRFHPSNTTILQRENTTACDFLLAFNTTLDLTHPRFKRAVHFCNGGRIPSFRNTAFILRELIADFKAGDLFETSKPGIALTWDTIAQFNDVRLVDDLARLARRFGYDDAPLVDDDLHDEL